MAGKETENMKNQDVVIISNNFWDKSKAGKIGFIIEFHNDNDDNEPRVDVQLPFDHTQPDMVKNGRGYNQANCSLTEITLLQSNSY